MTQEYIIEMAKQAEILAKGDEWVFDISNALALTVNQKQLEAFAKLVEQSKVNQIADACAKLPFGDTADSFAVWIRQQ